MTKAICFISPHPDDIELFAGGALLSHCKQEDNISVLMITNGENAHNKIFFENLGEIRQQEAQNRYAKLQNVKVTYLNCKDGSLINDKSLIEKCENFFVYNKFDCIYLPEKKQHTSYHNKDHLYVSEVITKICQNLSEKVTLRYYHSKKNNFFIDVSNDIKDVKRALKYYKSQYLLFLMYFISEIFKKKYYGIHNKCKYAEGFREFIN